MADHSVMANGSLMTDRSADNPLLPRASLLGMYRSMVRAQVLSGGKLAPGQVGTAPGWAAAWVAPIIALALQPGDRVSVAPKYTALVDVLTHVPPRLLATGRHSPFRLREEPERGLPRVLSALEGVTQAAPDGGRPLLLAFIDQHELTRAEWQQVLHGAVERQARVIFWVHSGSLSAAPDQPRAGRFTRWAEAEGIPGILVDAADALAQFRVAHETGVRLRMGGGPVLVEAVSLEAAQSPSADPLTLLSSQLIARQIVTRERLERFEARLRTSLRASLRE